MVEKEHIILPKDLAHSLDAVKTKDFMDHMKDQLEEEAGKRNCRYWATRILHMPGFDLFMGVVIVVNLFVMILEIDAVARDHEGGRSRIGQDTIVWTDVFGWLALLLFILELLVRMIALACAFWRDAWNVFDFIIVTSDAVLCLLSLIAGDLFPMSILRVFRLGKIARVSKVLRVFPELRQLLAGLIGSTSAIFWGTLLLFFCLLVWSMVAVLFIHPLNMSIDYGIECERCPRAYSTVMQATLTFWQQIVAGDSWGEVTIPLLERYPATVLFFVPVFLSIGMAVMNLILGVVVSVAQLAKDRLEAEEHSEKALFKMEKQAHLFELCKQMDVDGSGELSRAEVLSSFQEPGDFRDIMESLDITLEDFDIAWTIMDTDESGLISYKEFVCNLCRMKASDTAFMLAYIKYYVCNTQKFMTEQMKSMAAMEQRIFSDVEILKHEELAKRKMAQGAPQFEGALGELQEIEVLKQEVQEEKAKLGQYRDQTMELRTLIQATSSVNGERSQAALRAQQANQTGSSERRQNSSLAERENKSPYALVSPDVERLQDSLCVCEQSGDKQSLEVARANIGEQTWAKAVCQDIGMLRLELMGKLRDIDRKLSTTDPHISGSKLDGRTAEQQANLLIVSNGKAGSPPCFEVSGSTPSISSVALLGKTETTI